MDLVKNSKNQLVNGQHKVLFLFLALCLTISGCASMSKNECQTAQWQSIGYEDGTKGYSASRIGEYRKSCAEYNVVPDLAAYTEGRRLGLQEWCRPSNGYLQGTRGAVYNGICPKNMEAQFKLAMRQGRKVYEMRQKIKKQQAAIARLNGEFNAIEQDISDKETELVSNGTQPGRRILLLDEIRRSEQDREALRNDIAMANSALDKMNYRLKQMVAKNRYN